MHPSPSLVSSPSAPDARGIDWSHATRAAVLLLLALVPPLQLHQLSRSPSFDADAVAWGMSLGASVALLVLGLRILVRDAMAPAAANTVVIFVRRLSMKQEHLRSGLGGLLMLASLMIAVHSIAQHTMSVAAVATLPLGLIGLSLVSVRPAFEIGKGYVCRYRLSRAFGWKQRLSPHVVIGVEPVRQKTGQLRATKIVAKFGSVDLKGEVEVFDRHAEPQRIALRRAQWERRVFDLLGS